MADEKNKALENVPEYSAENAAANGSEICADQLESVAGGIIPPWYVKPSR